ncbi:MAG: lysine-sensitive aspartokinase 3 [Candidatus Obscuribacterales bacterium]|nr:lysine-sensitive aspartokinase 3 [Candidatus Obscuribacterales bacterium]
MIVMKFGGTSVGSAERMQEVVQLVKQAATKSCPVVVLSAMSGVTNALIAGAEAAAAGNFNDALRQVDLIRAKHVEAINAISGGADLLSEVEERLSELVVTYKGIAAVGELSKRSLDAVSGMGELLSSAIVARIANGQGLRSQWLDARKFMVTDDSFGRANPVWGELVPATREALVPLLEQGTVVFTQGFIGSTKNGVSTTLGRGGSDYSASIMGVAIDADEIQIWTDVDGMMTADPRVVKDARVISEVSFQEASELAYFGAKVLHPLTIKPAVEKKIPVRILNTFRPNEPGTLIKDTVVSDDIIRAVSSKKGITAIFISTPKMLMSYGFLAKVFAIFDRYQTSIDTIATSEISVALTIDQTESLKEIVRDLSEYGEVRVVHDVAIVSVVGRQYREKSGIAGRVFAALKDVNIVMISGGASDINLSFVVEGANADDAVRMLHAEFLSTVAVVKSISNQAVSR